MEGGALFNPGFLGGSFLWWVGQVADDSTWRENIQEGKHKSPNDIPGWGYRYKVRIIGLHDKEEATIPSDQLPWAQVMYPITAGGGQGGSLQSPGIKQGNFVFGFFLDGQDQQVPVIMGVLGANAQIAKAMQTGVGGGDNFNSQSGFANSSSDPSKKAPDSCLATERPTGTTSSGTPAGGDNPNNPPAANKAPTKETPAAPHQESAADKKKNTVLKRKHALACSDPLKSSPMKGIQTVIEELTKKIEEIQNAIQTYAAAISAGINTANNLINQINSIAALFEDAACEIAKFLLMLFNLVRDFVTDLFSKVLQPVFKIAPPTIKLDLLDMLMKALEIISCIFNKIGLSLCDSAKNSLMNSFKRRSTQAPPPAEVAPFITDELRDLPWLASATSADGTKQFYNPSPICYTEELVAEILGENLNDIIQGFDAALLPIVREVQESLDGLGTVEGTSAAGSSGSRPASSPLLPNIPNIPSLPNINGLGALGAGGFDIASALGFISAIMGIFSCDILPKCSANDTHTLQSGAGGKTKEDEPSAVTVAQKAQETALAQSTGGGTLTGAGTQAEANYITPNDVA